MEKPRVAGTSDPSTAAQTEGDQVPLPSIHPVTANIGAEVKGLDLGGDLPDAAIQTVRDALLRWKVLWFRDETLDLDGQVRFGRRLGTLTRGHPTLDSPDDKPTVLRFDSLDFGRADHWHTDSTFILRPPAISILRAVKIPPLGGDTMWANTECAYNKLPRPLQRMAQELRVVHSNEYDFGRNLTADRDPNLAMNRDRQIPAVLRTEHPMVQVHPETGKPALLLGGFAQWIVGFPTGISGDLLRIFQSYVLRPEHVVRWRWRPGDVAMWDNRCSQHYAVNDYAHDVHRVAERVVIQGDVPVGVDGVPSREIQPMN